MPAGLSVDAELSFSVDLPGRDTVHGRLTGSGTALELEVSEPFALAGRRDARTVRGLAEGLSRLGVTITIVAPSGRLVTLGAARVPWWQRVVTRSRHIRIRRGAGAGLLALRKVRAGGGALPSSDLLPPTMVWPIAPTFGRRPRPLTTTHGPHGGGRPRLIMAHRAHPRPGDRQDVFALSGEVTTIGSSPSCDITLAGLDPHHAEVRRDDSDEFVLVNCGESGETRVNGAAVGSAVLRTATRITLGDWTMSFYREEYADHGRPYGGRVGGEFGYQRPQPNRPGRTRDEWNGSSQDL